MNAKTSALVRSLQKRQAAFQQQAIGTLKSLSSEDRLKAMMKAGVLTSKGKLTTAYRAPVTAAAAR